MRKDLQPKIVEVQAGQGVAQGSSGFQLSGAAIDFVIRTPENRHPVGRFQRDTICTGQSSEHEADVQILFYPFTPPADRPSSRNRSRERKRNITGRDMIADAAITT